ncbi:MAG TPA: A/G-specific adenine glycosylase [Bacillota bacterium]|nr:A/G-specific adenine glycosylase [Bacillota bacterium]
MLTNFQIEAFQHDLLYWFELNLRDLPWRRDRDPYKIWVSEVMLQQTRVDTVIPYFERFLDKFPTIKQLAMASEEEVLKQWEGLGYYSRARNLHAGVREVQENYGGQVPNSVKEISSIRGIGPYTAGAVLSIAYGIPEPAVDGNVMRVLSRILLITEDIAKAKTRKQIENMVRDLISRDNPSFFNQALMELGALICVPRSPKCDLCPVLKHCRAYRQDVQEELPIKGKGKPPREVKISAVCLIHEGRFFIRKRPDTGLLAGLWELPNQEGDIEFLVAYLHSEYGIQMTNYQFEWKHQHTFSHLQWNMEVYSMDLESCPTHMIGEWVQFHELDSFTFPVSFQKIIEKLKSRFQSISNGK